MSQPPSVASRRRGQALSAAVLVSVIAALMATFIDPSGSILSIAGTFGYTVVGAIILRQRPSNGIGRLALAIGLLYSAGTILLGTVTLMTPPGAAFPVVPGSLMLIIEVVVDASESLQVAALGIGTILLITWFPRGHRTSRLGAVVQLGIVGVIVAIGLATLADPLMRTFGWSPVLGTIATRAEPAGIVLLGASWILAVIDLVLRYRKAPPIERVQMRWVVASIVASTLMIAGLSPFGEAFGDLWAVTMALPVVAITVAITRYRLYDIDHLVSRTIGYAIITAALFATFFGLNVLLQTAFGTVADVSPILVAISTLVVAALFQPLRTRVQGAVDRRFNRANIDRERTVASYAGRLREELDLQTLIGELERTTSSAVEPTRTVVWLRASADRAS